MNLRDGAPVARAPLLFERTKYALLFMTHDCPYPYFGKELLLTFVPLFSVLSSRIYLVVQKISAVRVCVLEVGGECTDGFQVEAVFHPSLGHSLPPGVMRL